MDVDEFDVDQGDSLSCPECGANLEVVGLSPVELALMSEDGDDDYDDRDDEDDSVASRQVDDDEEGDLD